MMVLNGLALFAFTLMGVIIGFAFADLRDAKLLEQIKHEQFMLGARAYKTMLAKQNKQEEA